MKKLIFSLVVIFLAACSNGADGNSGAVDGEFTVTDVWSRPTPAVAQNGVFYMTLHNRTERDEILQSVSTDVCQTVELHEMYDKGDGLMGMGPVEGGTIHIPAGETIELHPGGLHVMCIGKDGEFNLGDTIPLTLQFTNTGEVVVTAEVKESDE